MAHFAELDENNVVLRVLVVDDLHEADGHNFLSNTLGLGGTWVKTSYNTFAGEHLLGGTAFRKNFAGIGFIFDLERDAFYAPQPYPSWTLNEDSCIWQPPTPMPTDDKMYSWNEEDLAWEEVILPTE